MTRPHVLEPQQTRVTERCKLVRILRRLGSEHDGERAAAGLRGYCKLQADSAMWALLLLARAAGCA